MRKTLRCAWPLLAIVAIGCDSGPVGPPSGPSFSPPHGGNFVDLPEKKGSVEIVRNDVSKKNVGSESEFALYFFGPDHTTPLSPPPKSGTLSLNTPKGTKTVALQSKGDALVSPPAPAMLGGHELEGELSIDLDGGQAVKVPLSIR